MADRLSNLPDDILIKIISDLPIKSQAETGLLSKRWRNLWRRSPVLCLSLEALGFPRCHNDDYDLAHRSRDLIDDILDHWEAPSLQKLQLEVIFKWIPAAFVERWLRVAAARFVQDLCVSYTTPESINGSPHRLPPSFLDCSPSLSSLFLECCFLPPLPPHFQGFLALKTLHLSRAIIPGDDELSRLLLACPLLEGLKIERCRHHFRRLTVASPNLTALELQAYSELEVIVDELQPYSELEVIVDAPSLTTISVYGDATVSIRNDVPHLLAASFLYPFRTDYGHSGFHWWLPMLSHIRHVQVLPLDLYFLKLIVEDWAAARGEPAAFGDLKELHLNGEWLTDDSLRAIDVFLGKHPFLETVCVRLGHPSRRKFYDSGDGEASTIKTERLKYAIEAYETKGGQCKLSFKNRKSYLLPRLRMLRVFGFMGTRNEMRLVKFLLASAPVLESLHLFCAWTVPENLLKKLSRFCRTSLDARVLVTGDESWMDTTGSSSASSQSVHVQAIGGEHVVKDCTWHGLDYCEHFNERDFNMHHWEQSISPLGFPLFF